MQAKLNQILYKLTQLTCMCNTIITDADNI
jgi:hypothetical protein